MGSIGDCFDNSVAESFFGTLQLELLDEHRWDTRQQLAQAIFDWIEAWYNPRRRHSYCEMLSPIDYEAATRHDHNQQQLSAGSAAKAPAAFWGQWRITVHRGLWVCGVCKFHTRPLGFICGRTTSARSMVTTARKS